MKNDDDCNCLSRSWYGEGHDTQCPVSPTWNNKHFDDTAMALALEFIASLLDFPSGAISDGYYREQFETARRHLKLLSRELK